MSRAKRGWKMPRHPTSEASRKAAAGILQVLAGLRTPVEVGTALGVSVNRYYQLEQRALEGMLQALEPRARGPRARPGAAVERLEREKARLERELTRHQALLRTTQRALGMAPPVAAKEKPGKGRAKRPRVRAKAVIQALERAELTPAGSSVTGEGGAA